MWKDFFYYSKSERRVILFLLVLAVFFLGFYVGAGRWSSHESASEAEKNPAVDSFITSVKTKKHRDYPRREPRNHAVAEQIPVVLAPFDPNTADSVTLRRLGLSAFAVRNILKYRSKGGQFRTPESFSRIYGLSEAQYEELYPYIRIAGQQQKRDTVLHRSPVKQDSVVPYVSYKYPEGTVIDLNTADTTALKRIPGIGSGLARMIVAYRNRLGGFYNIAQLQEVPHVGEELNKWFKIESDSLHRLRVNRDGLDRLRAHPYMNFYKAKAIVEYRRKRGKIKSLSRLSLFEEFSEEDLRRLSPYLSFE